MKKNEVIESVVSKRKEQSAQVEELKHLRTAQLKRELDEARNEAEELRNTLKVMWNLSDLEVHPLEIKAKGKGMKTEATAVVLASDWHVLETVKKSEVNGLNEYNASAAKSSVESFFKKIAMLVDVERKSVRVDNLVLGLLGDLMTNQLHRDQIETSGGTPMEEILMLAELLTGGINFLLTQGFKLIHIPCCDGNHSRNTDKPQSANRVRHSYEWMLYCLLAKQYAGNKAVMFDIAEGQLLYTTLYGRKVRWTHGDALKYQGGVGGLTIPVRKAIAEWDKGQRADMTFFGHWHTSHLDKQFCSNGCLLGYAPYSVRIKAPFEPPQQAFMLFDNKRWLSSYRPIYVR